MSTNLKDRFETYSGPLTQEQLQVLRDMQGWIQYCIANGASLLTALGALSHDVNGILREGFEQGGDFGIMPKTAGYAKYLKQMDDLSGLADEPNPNEDVPRQS